MVQSDEGGRTVSGTDATATVSRAREIPGVLPSTDISLATCNSYLTHQT